MSEPIRVTGMVLLAQPQAEYDKRIVLLTKERGKITAFARGARKPNSTLLASTDPFAFGSYTVYEGRNSYTLVKAEVSQFFMNVKMDYEAACYGCYFMEVADYYTRENLDASDFLNLLYASLRALENEKLDNELIRCIFEMKAMVLNGEYPYETTQDPGLSASVRYTIHYIYTSSIQKLYTFTLQEDTFLELRRLQDFYNRRQFDKRFKSLEVLKTLKEIVETKDY